jgi:hypothetical protein
MFSVHQGIELRRDWRTCSTEGGRRNGYGIVIRKVLARPRHRWKDNVIVDVRGTEPGNAA